MTLRQGLKQADAIDILLSPLTSHTKDAFTRLSPSFLSEFRINSIFQCGPYLPTSAGNVFRL